MRLIDADVLQEEFEWLESNVYECGRDSVQDALERIKRARTISHEHLPIVRELRDENLKTECRADALMAKILVLEENLKQVTAERDAAVRDLYIAKDCNTCALRFTDDCLLEECMDPCNSFAYGNVPYKWRGLEGA